MTTTLADIAATFEHVFGTPLTAPRPAPADPQQELADERAIDRAIARRQDAMWASEREMDGAAADSVYGREPALDWRRP